MSDPRFGAWWLLERARVYRRDYQPDELKPLQEVYTMHPIISIGDPPVEDDAWVGENLQYGSVVRQYGDPKQVVWVLVDQDNLAWELLIFADCAIAVNRLVAIVGKSDKPRCSTIDFRRADIWLAEVALYASKLRKPYRAEVRPDGCQEIGYIPSLIDLQRRIVECGGWSRCPEPR